MSSTHGPSDTPSPSSSSIPSSSSQEREPQWKTNQEKPFSLEPKDQKKQKKDNPSSSSSSRDDEESLKESSIFTLAHRYFNQQANKQKNLKGDSSERESSSRSALQERKANTTRNEDNRRAAPNLYSKNIESQVRHHQGSLESPVKNKDDSDDEKRKTKSGRNSNDDETTLADKKELKGDELYTQRPEDGLTPKNEKLLKEGPPDREGGALKKEGKLLPVGNLLEKEDPAKKADERLESPYDLAPEKKKGMEHAEKKEGSKLIENLKFLDPSTPPSLANFENSMIADVTPAAGISITTPSDFVNLISSVYVRESHIDGHETTVNLNDGTSIYVKNLDGSLSITITTADYRIQKMIGDNLSYIRQALGEKQINVTEINVNNANLEEKALPDEEKEEADKEDYPR